MNSGHGDEPMKKAAFPILLAGVWIVFSEFLRNELLFKRFWVEHYSALGLTFRTTPFDGFLWTVWSFILAFAIWKLLAKFRFWETVWFLWLVSFVLMWIAAYALQVMPPKMLAIDVPLSLIELAVAGWIIQKMRK